MPDSKADRRRRPRHGSLTDHVVSGVCAGLFLALSWLISTNGPVSGYERGFTTLECGQDPPDDEISYEIFDRPLPGEEKSKNPGETGPEQRGWTVVLATYSLSEHADSAQRFADEFKQASGLTDVWIDSTPNRSIVRYGRFDRIDDPKAKTALRQVQAVEVNGRKPFQMAFLAPLSKGTVEGKIPQFNLGRVRESFPQRSDLYSLQVGVFVPNQKAGQKGVDEARKAAEAYAVELRARGEMAFYHHSEISDKSHVTVGVFFDDAFDPLTRAYGPEIQALQKRFPHNLMNGSVINETFRARNGKSVKREQRSFLIRVP